MTAREVIADEVFAVVGDMAVGALCASPGEYADRILEALDEAGFDLIERDGDHYIAVSDKGWSIHHPARCRPDLLGCIVHRAVEQHVAEYGAVMVDQLGRYSVVVDDDGGPTFTPMEDA